MTVFIIAAIVNVLAAVATAFVGWWVPAAFHLAAAYMFVLGARHMRGLSR